MARTNTNTGGGGGGAWSSITGNPTQVAYFDALGFGTSDANFTTTGTTFNLLRSPAVGDDIRVYIGDDALGFGIPGAVLINETVNGLNGVTIIDATLFGGGQNQSFYGFLNVTANQNANMKARYNSGTDEANLDWEATNSTNVGSRMQLNSRSTGTSTGFTVYGPNNSGNNSVFVVRDAGSSRLLFLDNDGNLQINNAWYLTNVDGLNGQVLHTNGAGQSYWATVSTTPSLTQNFIGYGSNINELTGDGFFIYNPANWHFGQTIPNNTGNAGSFTSPLTFGAASFTGSGLDDLTLTWGATSYGSEKYGGNLQVQIDSTGTPDTFAWQFTGGYSQTIGSGTGVSIVPGPIQLLDNDGLLIAEIEFLSDTGHTSGDRWNAGTSLSTETWGRQLSDSSAHAFFIANPVYGKYMLGDDPTTGGTSLTGNATRLDINDQLGEFSIYSPRYFRVEAPGGNTVALADMQSSVWTQYANTFKVRDVTLNNNVLLANTTDMTFSGGDIDGAYNHIYFKSDDANSEYFVNGLKYTATPTPTFTGSGLDDIILSGTFTNNIAVTYTVTVASSGTPDTFDWSDDQGNSGTGVAMSTSPITLSYGVKVKWGSNTGHTVTDEWTFTYIPTYGKMFDLFGSDQGMIIGDVDSIVNGTRTIWDIKGSTINNYLNGNSDGNFIVSEINSGNNALFILLNSTNQKIGFDISNPYIGATIISAVSDVTGVGIGLNVNDSSIGGYTTIIGDYAGNQNNTKIIVDDLNQLITVTNVPTYADDAAAITGGLTTGQLYKTTTGGITSLNIVP